MYNIRHRCISNVTNKTTNKVLVDNVNNYRTIIKILDRQKAEYHNYQIKQDGLFKVVLRDIHPLLA